MSEWPPQRFGDLSHDPLAKKIHAFINEEKTVRALVEYSELRRPAVEAISREFDARFGELIAKLQQEPGGAVWANRIKACAGKIIFDVLTQRGFQKEKAKAPVSKTVGGPFRTGARYRRTEGGES